MQTKSCLSVTWLANCSVSLVVKHDVFVFLIHSLYLNLTCVWFGVFIPPAAPDISPSTCPCLFTHLLSQQSSLSSHVSQSHLRADGKGVPVQVHLHISSCPEQIPLCQRDGWDWFRPARKRAPVAPHWGETKRTVRMNLYVDSQVRMYLSEAYKCFKHRHC